MAFEQSPVFPASSIGRHEHYSVGGHDVAVCLFPLAQADERFIADWVDLEGRAIEGNVFLSPHFVLPAHRHLDPRKRPMLLVVYHRNERPGRLMALGVLIARPPSIRFPLPHLEAYRSPHTFLTGILLDRHDHGLAVKALTLYLASANVPWCGIEFSDCLADGAIDSVRDHLENVPSLRWSEYYRHRRAVLFPSSSAELYRAVLADGSFGKELRRKRRRLEEQGVVTWRFYSGREVTPECIETFLQLEDQGWKKEDGRSMLSRAGHAEFFRQMSAGFAAEGRAFFTELMVGERVIASTCNYISGRTGFAFKIGWDQQFSAVSPGLLNELELMRNAADCLPGIDFIDSGASEGSFIERLWRDSRFVSTGVLTGGHMGAMVMPVLKIARRLKQHVSGRLLAK